MRTSNQGSADWKQDRAGFVTGSRVLDTMSYLVNGPKKGRESAKRRDYRLQLVAERLTGIPVEKSIGRNGDWGTEVEAQARIAYESIGDGVLVEQVGFIEHPDIEWVGASSDGLVGDDGCIEIKCPMNSGIHLENLLKGSEALYRALMGEELTKDVLPIPEEYIPQVQFGMWVLDRQWCDFISYDPRYNDERLRLHVHRMKRDAALIEQMQASVIKFLGEVEDAVSKLLLTGSATEEETTKAHKEDA